LIEFRFRTKIITTIKYYPHKWIICLFIIKKNLNKLRKINYFIITIFIDFSCSTLANVQKMKIEIIIKELHPTHAHMCVYVTSVSVGFSSLYSQWNLNFWVKEPPRFYDLINLWKLYGSPWRGLRKKQHLFRKTKYIYIYISQKRMSERVKTPRDGKMIIH